MKLKAIPNGLYCIEITKAIRLSDRYQAWEVTFKEPGALQILKFGFTSYRSEPRIYKLIMKTDVVNKYIKRSKLVLLPIYGIIIQLESTRLLAGFFGQHIKLYLH